MRQSISLLTHFCAIGNAASENGVLFLKVFRNCPAGKEADMEYLVTAAEMKRCDGNTIKHFGMSSMVLMERAALACVQELKERDKQLQEAARPFGTAPTGRRTLVVAGTGNNGGDGLAIGRLLYQAGFTVDFCLIGNEEPHCTEETSAQLAILERYGQKIMRKLPEKEYDIIIDSLFGIGLTRPVEGNFADAVDFINRQDAYVLSVDIPSGINSDTGAIMGCAVQADITVTFAFRKLGLVFYPGARYAGKVVCADIGITQESFLEDFPRIFTLPRGESALLPPRPEDGNKGTFGKVALLAGSRGMAGACQLSASAVLHTGAGMVRVVTDEGNRVILQTALPEAMITAYDQWSEAFEKELLHVFSWADITAIGPGLGQSDMALKLLEMAVEHAKGPIVVDADALNILAGQDALRKKLMEMQQDPDRRRELILTPHPGEFGRLAGKKIPEIQKDAIPLTREWAEKLQAVMICKGARTLVGGPDGKLYLNVTGNSGMATAGSGDVLTGILAGLLAQGMDAFSAACAGVYLHGCAGDSAAHKKSEYSVTAGALIDELDHLMPKRELNYEKL